MSWKTILKDDPVIDNILETFYNGFEDIMKHIEERNIRDYNQDGFKEQFRPFLEREFTRLKAEPEIDQLKAIFGYGEGTIPGRPGYAMREHPITLTLKGLEGYFNGDAFIRWVIFIWNVEYVPFQVMQNEENKMLGELYERCIGIVIKAGFEDLSTLIEAHENR
jgi:hypothetical protein